MKYVYLFKEGNADMRNLLGGKGANLAEMTKLGLPVPQGFTVTTEACTQYYEDGKQINADIQKEIFENIAKLEEIAGKRFGDKENPLLVSVRSGARASMPGMMDTILNLGLNDTTVEVLAKETNNPRFAYDSYRRFILMFTNVAKGLPRTAMDKMLEDLKGLRVRLEVAAAAENKNDIQVTKAVDTKDGKKEYRHIKNPTKLTSAELIYRDMDTNEELASYDILQNEEIQEVLEERRKMSR